MATDDQMVADHTVRLRTARIHGSSTYQLTFLNLLTLSVSLSMSMSLSLSVSLFLSADDSGSQLLGVVKSSFT